MQEQTNSVQIISNKRIAKNTILLYIRMMAIMAINLYSVKIVLNSLGAVDFGIYNVIGGVVTMFSFITTILSTSTQRYYSFALGKNDTNELKEIFTTSIQINFFLSLTIILIGELFGPWFINHSLKIPSDRLFAANSIFQATLLSFIFMFMQTPYSAAVIAHEKMGIFAIISTLSSIFKLGAAIFLSYSSTDKLILYGWLLTIISFLEFTLYIKNGRKKFPECKYHKAKNKKLRNSIISFSSWALFSSLAGLSMYQVNTILINIFFGPLASAARAISLQINTVLSSFCSSFLLSIRPPMIKCYAEKNYEHLNILFELSNKFLFYCLLIICIPLCFEMDTIIKLWLNSSDKQTIIFSRLIVIYSFILQLNNPISYVIQATEKIKQYSMYVEIFTLLCMPITYICFKTGFPAYTTYIIMIVCISFSHIVRLICLHKYYPHYKFSNYIFSFCFPAIIIFLISSSIAFFLHIHLTAGLLKILIILFLTLCSVFIMCYFFGLSNTEKKYVSNIIFYLKKKVSYVH